MRKLKTTTIFLIAGALLFALIPMAVSQQIPPLPMAIQGYVFIHRVTGEDVIAPAGLHLYVKVGTEVLQPQEGSQDITDQNGYYLLVISGPEEGTPLDIWVEQIYVTTVPLDYYAPPLTLNLTVVDTTAPTIEIISPTPGESFPPNQQVWINATLTDNLAIANTTITLTLNGTALTPAYNPETGLLSYKTSPLTSGLYIISLSVEDLAGNLTTETWSFTVAPEVPPQPPTVTIISPTTASPVYTRSDRVIQVTYQYTEANPKNATIKVYNSTHTIAAVTITELNGGTNVLRTDIVPIPAGAAEGSYHLNVTVYNIHELSATATETNAAKVDNTQPVVTINYPAEGSYISAEKVWINGTIVEANIGTRQPTIDDTRFTLQEWNSATGKFAFLNNTALPDSRITITVSFTDLAQNTASDTVAFTLDTTVPVISNPYQDPPGRVVQPGETVEVEVGYNITVKVNVEELNIERVSLYYNISTTQWAEIPMNPTGGNEYTATIPSSSYPPCTTIQYYIEAVDKAGNTAQTPTAGVYFTSHIISEHQKIMLAALLPTIALIIALNRKRKRKST